LKLLNNYDIRSLIDERAEKIGKKIRDAEVSKLPFMLIVGEKEAAENRVSVRRHGSGDLGSFTLEEFAEIIRKEIAEKLPTID
jgi:threonyl-tRNA synthetase